MSSEFKPPNKRRKDLNPRGNTTLGKSTELRFMRATNLLLQSINAFELEQDLT